MNGLPGKSRTSCFRVCSNPSFSRQGFERIFDKSAIIKLMNKKISWLIGIVALILVIAAGTVYYQVYHSIHEQSAVNQNIPSRIISDSSSPSGTPSGLTQYTDPHSGITFQYPNSWSPNTDGGYTYFTINDVDVLDITNSTASGTLEQIAQSAVAENNCPALKENGQPVDHIINSSSSGVLFILSCSATTNYYNYITYSPTGSVVDLSFHDAFPSDFPDDRTPSTFQTLIASVH
jgi:hypothetical protein